jgi:serine/threonine protein kinase
MSASAKGLSCGSARPATVGVMTEGLAAGTIVFGYEVGRLLGRGGMGTVYLARQLSLNRAVALKILHPHLLRNPAAVEDFLREARASARLNHPHLVSCHDAHADPEHRLYGYSMEYVPGRSVTDLMRAEGPLKRSLALHLAYQVASALGSAHQHDLVHRDVKPDNIMVTTSSNAKLLDLGLARDRLGGDSTTAAGTKLIIIGTPEFSAPEQSRVPYRATAASDVYSLGATIYYMFTGHPPFQGETVIDLIVRAATEEVDYPESIPEDCRALLALMLARDPLERLPHGAAVVSALEALAQGRVPTLPAPPPADDPFSAPTSRRKRRPLRRYR